MAITRAVGGGHRRADDGDVIKRGHVVQGITGCVQLGAELAIGDAGVDRGGVRCRVNRHRFVQLLDGDNCFGTVANRVKGVARADNTHFGRVADNRLKFGDGLGGVIIGRAIGSVAGPVLTIGGHSGFLWSLIGLVRYS